MMMMMMMMMMMFMMMIIRLAVMMMLLIMTSLVRVLDLKNGNIWTSILSSITYKIPLLYDHLCKNTFTFWKIFEEEIFIGG